MEAEADFKSCLQRQMGSPWNRESGISARWQLIPIHRHWRYWFRLVAGLSM